MGDEKTMNMDAEPMLATDQGRRTEEPVAKKTRTVQEIGKELLDALCELSPAMPALRKDRQVYVEISVHNLSHDACGRLAEELGGDQRNWSARGCSGIGVDGEKEIRFSLYLK